MLIAAVPLMLAGIYKPPPSNNDPTLIVQVPEPMFILPDIVELPAKLIGLYVILALGDRVKVPAPVDTLPFPFNVKLLPTVSPLPFRSYKPPLLIVTLAASETSSTV